MSALRGVSPQNRGTMNLVSAIIILVAVLLLITGGLVKAVGFLIWIGLFLAALAVVLYLVRSISGRNKL